MLPQGILLEVLGAGIMIVGEPGIGKGELALELLSRGHRLIADDAPGFHVEDGRIIGNCPAPIQDLLDVRGMGLLNIREFFGPQAIRPQQPLDLLIELRPASAQPPEQAELRLCGDRTTTVVLGHPLPVDLLYVAPGRHLAARVETMARRILREKAGYRLEADLESRGGKA